jgi:hypothetical protein
MVRTRETDYPVLPTFLPDGFGVSLVRRPLVGE